MDEMKRLRDRRQAYWELAREACEKFEYDNYDTYICAMELIDEQIRWREEFVTTIDVTALGDREPTYIATFNPGSHYPFQPLITHENTPKQKELGAYNEIFGRSVGIGMYTGTYLFWRKEFEETGATFAKERMTEAYKRGDEEAWEQGLKDEKFKRKGISIWRDTPLVWVLGGIGVVFLVLLLALV